jgi:hypothetical protein
MSAMDEPLGSPKERFFASSVTKTEPLRAGDVISYFDSFSVAGTPGSRCMAQVLTTDPNPDGEDPMITLTSGDLLDNDHYIWRLSEYRDGKMNQVWNETVLACQKFQEPTTGEFPLCNVRLSTLKARLEKYKMVNGIMSDKVGEQEDSSDSEATIYDEKTGYGTRAGIRQRILDGVKWIAAEIAANEANNEREKEEIRIRKEEGHSHMETVKMAAVGELKGGTAMFKMAANEKENEKKKKNSLDSSANSNSSGGSAAAAAASPRYAMKSNGASLAAVLAARNEKKHEEAIIKLAAHKEVAMEREKRKLLEVENERKRLAIQEDNQKMQNQLLTNMLSQFSALIEQKKNSDNNNNNN